MFCRQVCVWTPPVQRSIEHGPIVERTGTVPSSFQRTLQATPAVQIVLAVGSVV